MNPVMWAGIPFDQKSALAQAAERYFDALPDSQMGLWGIVDGLTGERIGKIDMWGNFKVVE